MTYKKFTKLSIYNELGNTFMFWCIFSPI
jgi:hypothetical protein